MNNKDYIISKFLLYNLIFIAVAVEKSFMYIKKWYALYELLFVGWFWIVLADIYSYIILDGMKLPLPKDIKKKIIKTLYIGLIFFGILVYNNYGLIKLDLYSFYYLMSNIVYVLLLYLGFKEVL